MMENWTNMNVSNSTTPIVGTNLKDHHDEDFIDTKMSLPQLVLLAVALLGISANGFVIYVYLRSKKKMDSSFKAVISLASTDLLTMACVGTNWILVFFQVTSIIFVCLSMSTTIFYLSSVTQLVLLIAIFDRYISIRHPERYSKIMNRRCFNTLLASAWLIPVPFYFLPLFGFSYLNEMQSCIPQTMFHEWIFITQSVFFILVMVLTVIFYIPIILKAIEFHKKTYPAKFHGVNASTARNKAKRRAVRYSVFIGFFTLFFMTCNLPFCIIRFQFGKNYSGGNESFITFLLGVINSMVNPFLYAFQKRALQQEAKQLIKCRRNNKVVPNQALNERRQLRQQVFLPLRPRPGTVNPFKLGKLENVDLKNGNMNIPSEENQARIFLPSTLRGPNAQGGAEEIDIIHLETFRESNSRPEVRQSTHRDLLLNDVMVDNKKEVETLHLKTCWENNSVCLVRRRASGGPILHDTMGENKTEVKSLHLEKFSQNNSTRIVRLSIHTGQILNDKLGDNEEVETLHLKQFWENSTACEVQPSTSRASTQRDIFGSDAKLVKTLPMNPFTKNNPSHKIRLGTSRYSLQHNIFAENEKEVEVLPHEISLSAEDEIEVLHMNMSSVCAACPSTSRGPYNAKILQKTEDDEDGTLKVDTSSGNQIAYDIEPTGTHILPNTEPQNLELGNRKGAIEMDAFHVIFELDEKSTISVNFTN